MDLGVKPATQRLYIGIDPGVTGAVAAIDQKGQVISLQDTPTITVKRGKVLRREYAEPAMAALLEGILQSAGAAYCPCGNPSRHLMQNVLVALENVHSMPKQGVASSFSFGVGFGVWRGIIATLGLPHERVEPGVWKRALKLTANKGTAVAKALRLFPRAELGHAFQGRMIYSDGRAEALLLAYYALQQANSKTPLKSKA